MTGKKELKKAKKKTDIRFVGPEHYELVRRAAEIAGLSINGWLVSRTLVAARREVKAFEDTQN